MIKKLLVIFCFVTGGLLWFETLRAQDIPKTCVIKGNVKYIKDKATRYRYVDVKEISPLDIEWKKDCEQFQHNHYTDFEVPGLYKFHINQNVIVKYVYGQSIWYIDSVYAGDI